jgi:hypothetical protein
MTIRSQVQEWKSWKREAAAGAFQENEVLQGTSPVQFKARTGENRKTQRQLQARGDKNVLLLEI